MAGEIEQDVGAGVVEQSLQRPAQARSLNSLALLVREHLAPVVRGEVVVLGQDGLERLGVRHAAVELRRRPVAVNAYQECATHDQAVSDRKSTRLNSSH